jgi:transketolase
VHGTPLTEDQIQELRNNLNYKVEPFVIHQSVQQDMNIFRKRGIEAHRQFNMNLQKLEGKDINLYNQFIKLSKNQFDFDLN